MICCTSSLIRQLYHFATDFDGGLLQLVGTDIENSPLKYRVRYRHLTFMIETFELLMKSCENLTFHSCIFNVQLHHLKKWTLKFKLLYLRNYASYFNKIRSISCVNTHIKNLKVWLKSILPWLKYSIFSRGLFFIDAPRRYNICSWKKRVKRLFYTGNLNINKTSYWYDVTNDGNCPRITNLVKMTIKLPFSAFYDVIYQNLLHKFIYIAVSH